MGIVLLVTNDQSLIVLRRDFNRVLWQERQLAKAHTIPVRIISLSARILGPAQQPRASEEQPWGDWLLKNTMIVTRIENLVIITTTNKASMILKLFTIIKASRESLWVQLTLTARPISH